MSISVLRQRRKEEEKEEEEEIEEECKERRKEDEKKKEMTTQSGYGYGSSRILWMVVVLGMMMMMIGGIGFWIGMVVKWRNRVWIHGKECEMSYSRPNYIPVENYKTENYQLYQFIDWMDVHHRHLLLQPHSTTSISMMPSCNHHHHHMVLFLPGHAGSYQQVRSLGAHIIQHPSYTNTNPVKVYTLEWLTMDGSPFHPHIFQHQVQELQTLLLSIHNNCRLHHNHHITIVAHSLGGIVARTALNHLTTTTTNNNIHKDNIRLITMATPHAYFPYTFFWDTTPFLYYDYDDTNHHYDNNQSLYEIISISAGYRDQLIPPSSTVIPTTTTTTQSNNHKLYLASHISTIPPLSNTTTSSSSNTQPQQRYGMDHQAIVWCHHVLQFIVHDFIFPSSSSKQTQYYSSTNFHQQLQTMQNQMIQTHGILSTTLLYLTMPYTIAYLLLNIYPIIVILHTLLQQLSTSTSYYTPVKTILLLSFLQYITNTNYPFLQPNTMEHHNNNNNDTMTIVLTWSINIVAMMIFFLHRFIVESIGPIIIGMIHSEKNNHILPQDSNRWTKTFQPFLVSFQISMGCCALAYILFLLSIRPSSSSSSLPTHHHYYYTLLWIFIRLGIHVWTCFTFLPSLRFVVGRCYSHIQLVLCKHLLQISLITFFPMYCIFMIRECMNLYHTAYYYQHHRIDDNNSLIITFPFLLGHAIILIWNTSLYSFLLHNHRLILHNHYEINSKKRQS